MAEASNWTVGLRCDVRAQRGLRSDCALREGEQFEIAAPAGRPLAGCFAPAPASRALVRVAEGAGRLWARQGCARGGRRAEAAES